MVLLSVLLTLLVVAASVTLIIAFGYWVYVFVDNASEYISFKKFLKYYNMDPNKWNLYDNEVKLKNGPYLQFGPIGFWRYKFHKFNTDQQDTNQLLEELFGGKDETSI